MIALSFVSALVLTTYYFQIQSGLTTYVLSVNRAGGGPASRSFQPPQPLAELLETPYDIGLPQIFFNFPVEVITFIMQCRNELKLIFPIELNNIQHQMRQKIKCKCHLQNLDRNMFSTFFAIKLIISSYVCLIFGKALQISGSPTHLLHWGKPQKVMDR